MNAHQQELARVTLEGAESGAVTFPQGVQMLMEAGFDSYAVDFRRSTRIYYLASGDALELETPPATVPVAQRFDAAALRAAIREAQALVPGYNYRSFCAKAAAAGCAGYLVSCLGQRVVYYGRTGETHVEHFPDAQP